MGARRNSTVSVDSDTQNWTAIDNRDGVILHTGGEATTNKKQAGKNIHSNNRPLRDPISLPEELVKEEMIKSFRVQGMTERFGSVHENTPNTCQWLLKTPEFREWQMSFNVQLFRSENPYRRLFCIKGKPGTGKSTYMNYVAQYARRSNYFRGNLILIHCFNDRAHNELDKSIEGMYRNLLTQVLQDLPPTIVQKMATRLMLALGRTWELETLSTLFRDLLREYNDRRVTCFIDTRNEWTDTQMRAIFRSFRDLAYKEPPYLKFRACFASRYYPSFTIPEAAVIDMKLEQQPGHSKVIEAYIESCLHLPGSRIAAPLRIRKQILMKAELSFVWSRIVIDTLNKECDQGSLNQERVLLEKVAELPRDLHSSITYNSMLSAVEAQMDTDADATTSCNNEPQPQEVSLKVEAERQSHDQSGAGAGFEQQEEAQTSEGRMKRNDFHISEPVKSSPAIESHPPPSIKERCFDNATDHDNDAASLSKPISSPAEFMGFALSTATSVAHEVADFCVSLLIRQDDVVKICSTALTSHERSILRFERKFRRLIATLATDLAVESDGEGFREAAILLRRQAPYIARRFGDRASSERPMMVGATSHLEASGAVEGYLENLRSPGQETPPEDTENSDDDEFAENEVDHSDNDGLDYGTIDLNSFERFIIQSQAFIQFQANLNDLIFPTFHSELRDLVDKSTRRLAREDEDRNANVSTASMISELKGLELDLLAADPRHVATLNGGGGGVLDRIQLFLERVTGQKWDWWPLLDPQPPCIPGVTYVRWRCECGTTRFQALDPGFALKLSQLLDRFRTNKAHTAVQQNSPGSSGSTNSAPLQRPASTLGNQGSRFTGQRPLGNKALSGTPNPSLGHQHVVIPMAQLAADTRVVFLAVEKGDDCSISQISVSNSDDRKFFGELRTEYLKLRGWRRRLFSYHIYSHCEFAQVEKIGPEIFAVGDNRPSLPENTNSDYVFIPKPPNPVPPISKHEFRMRFYSCDNTPTFLHRIGLDTSHRTCRRFPSTAGALERIPKRNHQLLVKTHDRELVWGLLATECPSVLRILLYHVPILAGPFAFNFLWLFAWGHNDDLQGAVVPLTVVCVLLSMFWMPMIRR